MVANISSCSCQVYFLYSGTANVGFVYYTCIQLRVRIFKLKRSKCTLRATLVLELVKG